MAGRIVIDREGKLCLSDALHHPGDRMRFITQILVVLVFLWLFVSVHNAERREGRRGGERHSRMSSRQRVPRDTSPVTDWQRVKLAARDLAREAVTLAKAVPEELKSRGGFRPLASRFAQVIAERIRSRGGVYSQWHDDSVQQRHAEKSDLRVTSASEVKTGLSDTSTQSQSRIIQSNARNLYENSEMHLPTKMVGGV